MRHEGGATLRLYSGRSGALRSSTRNHVPVTVAALDLLPGASLVQEAPSSHNGFFYPLEGRVRAGGEPLTVGQVGWLDRPQVSDPDATIRIGNDSGAPARVLFYSGERQNSSLVTYGPFVGGTPEDLQRAFRAYQAGGFPEF